MTKKNHQKTCYMCDKPAVSREHAPPKCIFPEIKDTGGIDYRKELIRVPSCHEHNSQTSKDDEYFMVIVADHFQNNDVADIHIQTKINRTLAHSKKLQKRMNRAKIPVILDGNMVTATQTEPQRLHSQFDKMARAIYHYHYKYKRKWLKNVLIDSPSLLQFQGETANQENLFWQGFSNEMKSHLLDATKIGENTDVFYYQFCQLPSQYPFTVLRMVIYGGFIINAVYDGLERGSIDISPPPLHQIL